MRRAALVLALISGGCNQILGNGHDFKGPGADAPAFDAPVDSCTSCMQVDCASMGLPPTTITGHVYMPDGVTPISNAMVYVPGTALAPIADGVSGPACASGQPIVRTTSAPDGSFTLTNAPSGSGVQLVVQVGKWRREDVVLPSVPKCTTTMLTDPNQTRLPKLATEGHIPRIAITTGGADTLECIAKDIGIDPTQIGVGGSSSRVELYVDNGTPNMANTGTPLPPATQLYSTFGTYDIVMFGCIGAQTSLPIGAPAALQSFVNSGGWAFLTHIGSEWLQMGPSPWPMLATFVNNSNPPPNTPVTIDTTAPTGSAFAQWLVPAGASTTVGQFVLANGRNTCASNDAALTQRVMFIDPMVNNGKPSVQGFTWTGANRGRMTFSDIHVTNMNTTLAPYPQECLPITDTEKVLMFQLFDVPPC